MRIENFEEFGVEETHTGERERERERDNLDWNAGWMSRKERKRTKREAFPL